MFLEGSLRAAAMFSVVGRQAGCGYDGYLCVKSLFPVYQHIACEYFEEKKKEKYCYFIVLVIVN